MKAPYIGYSKDQVSIDMMRRVKQMFDPKGILNPYKFIL
jgi:FAD/FMN-containing dehydrogenase